MSFSIRRMLGLRPAQTSDVPERTTDPRSDVVALAINWVVDDKPVLMLMIHVDGSIRRMGDGSPSCPDQDLYVGPGGERILESIVSDASPELFQISGALSLQPIVGTRCALKIQFWRTGNRANGFEMVYGSQSEGPHPAIVDLVTTAICNSQDWYETQQRMVVRADGSQRR